MISCCVGSCVTVLMEILRLRFPCRELLAVLSTPPVYPRVGSRTYIGPGNHSWDPLVFTFYLRLSSGLVTDRLEARRRRLDWASGLLWLEPGRACGVVPPSAVR